MRVGLVRHFKVKKEYPAKKLISTAELMQWFEEYENAEIEKSEVNLNGIPWNRCFASDLLRSRKTAEAIYHGDIVMKKELREISISNYKSNIKLPFLVWAMIERASWILNSQKRMEIKEVQWKLGEFLDGVLMNEEREDVLIVSHGALMMLMRKELIKRGFRGPRLSNPENGRLYVYER